MKNEPNFGTNEMKIKRILLTKRTGGEGNEPITAVSTTGHKWVDGIEADYAAQGEALG
jgi:hypothetical protein